MAEGRLTTHVLDTASGAPAAGLLVELVRLSGEDVLACIRTNADGRSDAPLLGPADMAAGAYELRFHAGDYLRRAGAALPAVPFLDVIPIRFGIDDPGRHYHVPLLLSPYGYSTYRGS